MRALDCEQLKDTRYPVLKALKTLTDETGILQHAKFSIIDRRKGYTSDDNARALIAALKYYNANGNPDALNLANRYFTFLLHMQKEDGSSHNLLGFDRRYKDEVGSEDSMGRSIWAMGYTQDSKAPIHMKIVSKEIIDKSLPLSRSFTSPRAIAFTLMGLTHYYKANRKDANILNDIERFAERLIEQYNVEKDQGWNWFEPYLTYANPRIPQALFQAYDVTSKKTYMEIGNESLDFLTKECFSDDTFQPIGSNGWYIKGGEKAFYDQQPVEASSMVEAALHAMKHTGEEKYREVAINSFRWYSGKNIKKAQLIDQRNHLCYDGITEKGINKNQGAESTITYIMAYLDLKENNLFEKKLKKREI